MFDTLHLYAQYAHHADAWIVGTRATLQQLRSAIDAVLDGGALSATTELETFTTDGEGYAVRVVLTDADDLIQSYVLPYTAKEYQADQEAPQWPRSVDKYA